MDSPPPPPSSPPTSTPTPAPTPAPAIITSPFPDPPPASVPTTNAHNVFFNRPEQALWPDFTLQIDAATGARRTYREFVERVRDVGSVLAAGREKGGLGLGSGEEIVGILSDNSMDYITLVHALLMIAVPFALVSSSSTPFELTHALTLSKATHLFVDAKFLPLVLPVAKRVGLPSRRIYVLQGRAHEYGQGQRRTLEELREVSRRGRVERVAVRKAERDTLAYLVFSSGTSGLPKAVMISHGNIIYSVAQAATLSKIVQQVYKPPTPPTPEGIPIALAFLPMYHSYGLHAYCFRAFLQPSTLVMAPRWEIKSALRYIAKYRITNLAMIPSVVHQLVNYPKIEKADLSSIITVNSGAAYLPPDLAAKMSSLLSKTATFGEGYGMSETTIAAIVQPLPGVLNLQRIPGSTGVLLPGMQARIVEESVSSTGAKAIVDLGASNRPGELWLRSPNIAIGYWNNDKANREAFERDGWLRTGDRFRVDEEGYFYFEDRAKDTLKVSGTQVSPVEIENVLLSHPDKLISDVTVAGVSGGRTSDEKVPRAWIVLSPQGKKVGIKETIGRLEEWQKENLSSYKWLRGGFEVVHEIPKSPTGKVLRRVLQEKYERSSKAGYKIKARL